MSRRFVIDAGVTLAWLFNEDGAAKRIDPMIENAELVAPWIWRLEVVNVILVKERRKLLTIAQATHLLELLDDLAIEVIAEIPGRSLLSIAAAARPHQLGAYDAAYLDLALSLRLPLFTRDHNLQIAARRVGVELV